MESPGRRQGDRSVEVLHGGGDAALTKFQKQGYFERVERVALTPHGGTVNGFLLLFGERAKLDELRRTDEFERFSIRLMMLFDGYGVVPGLNNEGLAKAMARTKDLITESRRA
jgi:hypothetical protein